VGQWFFAQYVFAPRDCCQRHARVLIGRGGDDDQVHGRVCNRRLPITCELAALSASDLLGGFRANIGCDPEIKAGCSSGSGGTQPTDLTRADDGGS
jgi:hypothetical protein